jgi:hypothetical protein
VDRNGYHVHWDAVPAWVREQCSEPYFESAEVLPPRFPEHAAKLNEAH